jgi:hypothetical protein
MIPEGAEIHDLVANRRGGRDRPDPARDLRRQRGVDAVPTLGQAPLFDLARSWWRCDQSQNRDADWT